MQEARGRGNVEALCSLAYCYLRGFSVEKSDELATQLYREASDLGDPGATRNLALMVQSEDPAQAVALFQRSVAGGNRLAITNLAGAYRDGLGVPADQDKAKELYLLAAERGDVVT